MARYAKLVHDLAEQSQLIRVLQRAGTDVNVIVLGNQPGWGFGRHTDGDLLSFPKMKLAALGRVRGLERLADRVKSDTRVVSANGRVMTGSEVVRHRDMRDRYRFRGRPRKYLNHSII